MPLSENSYEILSDLLVLRLETFLVTSTDEARELKMLKHAQRELENLQNMGSQLVLPAPAASAQTNAPAASKLPRRLQRLIRDVAEQQTA